MTKKNTWLTGITIVAALSAGAFMPTKAVASNNCCLSRWSAVVSTNGNHGPASCNITNGYVSGGVQYNMYTDATITETDGIDSFNVTAQGGSNNGYSPGVRMSLHCGNNGIAHYNPGFFWDHVSGYCDGSSYITSATCQTQSANSDPNSGCNSVCQ